jgi:hypothetical protein
MVWRRGKTEFWIEDDESRAHAGVQEALFVVRAVICSASEGEVLAAAKAGWNGDERDFWFGNVGRDIGAFYGILG